MLYHTLFFTITYNIVYSKYTMSESENLILIGKNITKIRKLKKLTIKELGYKCDMGHGNLIPIEKGRINVTVNTLYKIATALEVDIKAFFEL